MRHARDGFSEAMVARVVDSRDGLDPEKVNLSLNTWLLIRVCFAASVENILKISFL